MSEQVTASAGPAFPRAQRGKGYRPEAVNAFLTAARESYDGVDGRVTAASIRSISFPLVRQGLDIQTVDEALIRLEDAFAARERERAILERGTASWLAEARERAGVILDRLSRKPGHRFARTSILTFGYRVKEVDAACDRLSRFLRDGEDLDVVQVRRLAFRMTRRGYREEQVDALLDAVIEVILAVR